MLVLPLEAIAMALPFTDDEFLAVFASYNEAVWPAQLVLTLVGLTAVMLALRGGSASSRIASGLLASMWGWMGLAYHWAFFSAINPAAYLFGLLFVIQALGLLWWGSVRGKLKFHPAADAFGIAGALVLAYALHCLSDH